MGKLKSVKIVDNISLDLVKNGQYIKIYYDRLRCIDELHRED